MNRTRKAGVLVTSMVAVLGVSTVLAHAGPATDTEDHYSLANTQLYGVAAGKPAQCPTTGAPTTFVSCFSVPGNAPTLTVYCKNSTAGGITPAATAPLGYFPLNHLPTFHDGTGPCTDSLGGTESNLVQQGTNGHKWQIKEVDKANDETGTVEPNATGDSLNVLVPQAGVIVTTSQGCKITVSPSGDAVVGGSYNDAGVYHTVTTTLHVIVQKLKTSCPLPAGVSITTTFYAIYTFHSGSPTGPVAKVFDK